MHPGAGAAAAGGGGGPDVESDDEWAFASRSVAEAAHRDLAAHADEWAQASSALAGPTQRGDLLSEWEQVSAAIVIAGRREGAEGNDGVDDWAQASSSLAGSRPAAGASSPSGGAPILLGQTQVGLPAALGGPAPRLRGNAELGASKGTGSTPCTGGIQPRGPLTSSSSQMLVCLFERY